jgi:hypothetical protein
MMAAKLFFWILKKLFIRIKIAKIFKGKKIGFGK